MICNITWRGWTNGRVILLFVFVVFSTWSLHPDEAEQTNPQLRASKVTVGSNRINMDHQLQGRLQVWFRDKCGIDAARAASLSRKLEEECLITNVSAFKDLVMRVPHALEALNIPPTLRIILQGVLRVSENKALERLNVHEVSTLLQKLFPTQPAYAKGFQEKRINGFVLCSAMKANQLEQWGIDAAEDATVFLDLIDRWRVTGVPPQHLTDTDKPEVHAAEDEEATFECDEGKEQDTSPLRKRRLSTVDTPAEAATSPSPARKRATSPAAAGSAVPAGSAVAAREALLAEVDAQLRADYVKEQVAGLCDLQKALTSGTIDLDDLSQSPAWERLLGLLSTGGDDEVIVKIFDTLDALLAKTDETRRRALLLGKAAWLNRLLAHACGTEESNKSKASHVRLAALRQLEKMCVMVPPSAFLTEASKAPLTNGYFAGVGSQKPRAREATRHYFAAMLKALSQHRPEELSGPERTALQRLLPILHDILSHDSSARTTFPAACAATVSILSTGAPAEVGDVVAKYELQTALIARLDDGNKLIMLSALGCLTEIVSRISDDRAEMMLPAFSALERVQAASSPAEETITAVARFAEAYLRHGDAVVAGLVSQHPATFVYLKQLLDEPDYAIACRHAAHAVLLAAHTSSNEALAELLGYGLYGALFRILAVFPATVAANEELLLQALDQLRSIVLRVEEVEAQDCREPRAARWRRVTKLAEATGKDSSSLGVAVGDETPTAVPSSVKLAASRLLVTARTLKIAH